jgi:hypothetical protein
VAKFPRAGVFRSAGHRGRLPFAECSRWSHPSQVALSVQVLPGPIVEEPLAWVEEYPIQWREPRLNLAELAKLRWIEGLSTQELAKHFDKTIYSIENCYQAVRKTNFEIEGLSAQERKQIIKLECSG